MNFLPSMSTVNTVIQYPGTDPKRAIISEPTMLL